ncbi:hypothetical protein QUF75_06865 [Desulfococcaceae bacterium HSG7]|nr:hypothetical protein [Desulfococcaceae bacterium HSG7]
MKHSRKKNSQLKEMLKSAYDAKAESYFPDTDEQWEMRVMQRIRAMSHADACPDFYSLFNQFVWRLAPVSVIIIVALTVIMNSFDILTDLEIASMLADDPMGFSLNQMFNIQTG